jgi:hypothetical protein
MPTAKIFAALALGFLILSAVGCGPKVDLRKDLAITDVTSGYFDAGIIKDPEGEKNRILPSIAFKLKNISTGETIDSVQINAVYHAVNEKDKEWGTSWVKGIGSDGLKPGQSTQMLVLRSDRGFTGLQPRMQLLQNVNFVDVVVDIMCKYRADQYVKLGSYPITRQLLTQ